MYVYIYIYIYIYNVCVCVSSWRRLLSLLFSLHSNPSPATVYPTEDWINILDPLTKPTQTYSTFIVLLAISDSKQGYL
jgi:hypothetical protein